MNPQNFFPHIGHLSISVKHLMQADTCLQGSNAASISLRWQTMHSFGFTSVSTPSALLGSWLSSMRPGFWPKCTTNTLITVLYGFLQTAHWFSVIAHWLHENAWQQGIMATVTSLSKQILQIIESGIQLGSFCTERLESAFSTWSMSVGSGSGFLNNNK